MLKDTNYCIFGLGDTSYEQFNEMALFCDRSFAKLGANRIGEIGAGNAETHTTEEDFQKWKQPLWEVLFNYYSKFDTADMK